MKPISTVLYDQKTGATAARTFKEGAEVMAAMQRTTGRRYSMSDGPRDYRSGKPLCFIIAPVTNEVAP